MADNKFSSSGDDYTKIMNNICLRILDRCNFTNLNMWVEEIFKLNPTYLFNFHFQSPSSFAARNLFDQRIAQVYRSLDEVHLAQCEIDAESRPRIGLRGTLAWNTRFYAKFAKPMVDATSIWHTNEDRENYCTQHY